MSEYPLGPQLRNLFLSYSHSFLAIEPVLTLHSIPGRSWEYKVLCGLVERDKESLSYGEWPAPAARPKEDLICSRGSICNGCLVHSVGETT